MPLLIGRYEYTIDPKSRVAVPPKFRETLRAEKGGLFYLTSGLEGCLYLFLPSQWNRLLTNDLAAFSMNDKALERAFKRKFFSEAAEAAPDSAGRILLPQYLRSYAGLRGQVLVQGAGTRAEIWDRAKWNSYSRSKADPTYRIAAKRLEI